MEILLSIAIALLCGLLMTRVIKPLGLPAVTGYETATIVTEDSSEAAEESASDEALSEEVK